MFWMRIETNKFYTSNTPYSATARANKSIRIMTTSIDQHNILLAENKMGGDNKL